MSYFNKVFLMGRLTKDPEVKNISNELKVCKIFLALSKKYKKNEEVKEETTFVEVDSFGKVAETIEKYVKKGDPIFVEGRLKLDKWENKNGEKRYKLKVVLENFHFIKNSKKDNTIKKNDVINNEDNDYIMSEEPF